MAVLKLQQMLAGARVVYCSATGASEPRNLAYMTRLGLWGPGIPAFADFQVPVPAPDPALDPAPALPLPWTVPAPSLPLHCFQSLLCFCLCCPALLPAPALPLPVPALSLPVPAPPRPVPALSLPVPAPPWPVPALPLLCPSSALLPVLALPPLAPGP